MKLLIIVRELVGKHAASSACQTPEYAYRKLLRYMVYQNVQ